MSVGSVRCIVIRFWAEHRMCSKLLVFLLLFLFFSVMVEPKGVSLSISLYVSERGLQYLHQSHVDKSEESETVLQAM